MKQKYSAKLNNRFQFLIKNINVFKIIIRNITEKQQKIYENKMNEIKPPVCSLKANGGKPCVRFCI